VSLRGRDADPPEEILALIFEQFHSREASLPGPPHLAQTFVEFAAKRATRETDLETLKMQGLGRSLCL
jgi:hypothetical protein